MFRPNVLSPLSTTTDYVNGYIFTNNGLSMAQTGNGYFTLSSTGDPTYHFYLKDHQGNNRVVVSQSGSVEQTNHYYPYGALFEWQYLHVRHYFGRNLVVSGFRSIFSPVTDCRGCTRCWSVFCVPCSATVGFLFY